MFHLFLVLNTMSEIQDTSSEVVATPSKSSKVWNNEETQDLLDKYVEYMNMTGPFKKFKNKKIMWEHLAKEINAINDSNWTARQCEMRYQTVLRRKKPAVECNRTRGSKRVHIEFEEELNKNSRLDDSIEPKVQISSQEFIRKECVTPTSDSSSSSPSPKPKLAKKSLIQTHLESQAKKERNQKRRHREKMEMCKVLNESILKLIPKSD